MLLVKDLPSDQHMALQSLVGDVNSLYSSYSKEYMEHWEKGCNNDQVLQVAPDVVKQVEEGAKLLGLYHLSRFVLVESNYYDWELQQRSFRVNAPSRSHMCKTLIMENTRCTHNDITDPLYSRFYCVITRYDSPVNTQVLLNFARSLNNKAISKKNYNFRLADSQVSLEMTGYKKGGVCPVGMKSDIPMIMAESVTRLSPPVMYMGAGHIDWKLGVPVQDFINKTGCMVANLD
ncbi:YbaK/aminoacyl-tRNA synthetase-associated domain-containing protein [Absidia repens]|uniref:YbaK/aminoacyl-tRNA synthetase-associated domain-containing protein n=1 Tax=Absidia repens TaxID=90262 RepID=A0A1X2IBE4_9FUNG|nr:YbaK/aminoacyl-tRNA synthetase-associated domain-containing protein [Absidia repens]